MFGTHNLRYCGDFNRIHSTNPPAPDQTYVAVTDTISHHEHLVVFTGSFRPNLNDPSFLEGVIDCVHRAPSVKRFQAGEFRFIS